MAELLLPSSSASNGSPRLADTWLSDASTCSSTSGIGDVTCGNPTDAHASHSQEIEALRTFACLQAASTKKLEKRVSDLETQLREQVDERQGTMLSQALLMKKVARLEIQRCDFESLINPGQSSCAEQANSFEIRLEHLQTQLDATLKDLQPLEFERRLESLSTVGEKALEEAKRTSMELIAAASRFTQQLALVGSCQRHDDVERPLLASDPQEMLRTTCFDLSCNLPMGAALAMKKCESGTVAEKHPRRIRLTAPEFGLTSCAPLPHLLDNPGASQTIQGPSKLQEHKQAFSVKTRTRGASAASMTAVSICH